MRYNKLDHSNLPWLGKHTRLCKKLSKIKSFSLKPPLISIRSSIYACIPLLPRTFIMMVRAQMIQTDINKGLKMLVNETRGSFVGAENKKCAAPAFVVVVWEKFCMWMGWDFWHIGWYTYIKRSLWLVSPSDKSKKFLFLWWFIFIQFIQLATLIIYLQTSACTEWVAECNNNNSAEENRTTDYSVISF